MTLPKTSITRLLNIRLPLLQAGMSWASSNAELPAAVSEAGGLGVVAAGPMRPDDLRTVLTKLRERTAEPFAVNVPLYGKYRDEHLQIVEDMNVPVLIASQGGPTRYSHIIANSNTTCLHVISSLRQARKAVRANVDGLIVVGGEAGGHPPVEQVSVVVSARAIRREFPNIPLVTSGGVADGYGVAAMLSIGADAVQMGTRFAATVEANLHPAYKRLLVETPVDGTKVIGKPGKAIRIIPNMFAERYEELQHSSSSLHAEEYFDAASLREAANLGDVNQGKVEAGQTVGLIDEILPARMVIEQIIEEYANAISRLSLQTTPLHKDSGITL